MTDNFNTVDSISADSVADLRYSPVQTLGKSRTKIVTTSIKSERLLFRKTNKRGLFTACFGDSCNRDCKQENKEGIA